MRKNILWFKDITIKDVPIVGGKNASLGEMIRYLQPKGINIPNGFVITADAYRYFLQQSYINFGNSKQTLENFINNELKNLDTKNLKNLQQKGKLIRTVIRKTKLPLDLENDIIAAYHKMEQQYGKNVDVAVRSSATAEDLPGASFAGQQETYLNIRGTKELIDAIRADFASLFTDRAISYRADKGFSHTKVALSVGVEKMVRSDLGCSGVMFTVDTESGFKNLVVITGSWGLGEMIVQGEVIPDEFLVFKTTKTIIDKKIGKKDKKMIYGKGKGIKETKIINTSNKEQNNFILSDKEILQLAEWGMMIEKHYSDKNKKWTPMDIEWAKDGKTNKLFIVQARPETVQVNKDFSKVTEYKLNLGNAKIIIKGISVGNKIANGKAHIILNVKDINKFKAGEILVTDMTDPDWEPIMKIAAGIITNKGGRTSHAAIVSRELGIPCVVGTEYATTKIHNNQMITIDTTGSEGIIYDGKINFKIVEHNVNKLPKLKTKIMVNIATPETAFQESFLPVQGVGLAREEFIIAGDIGIHPMALINYKNIADQKLKNVIEKKVKGWNDKQQFYVDKLAFGIAKIAAAFYPYDVIVRFSDFKTNEYRALIGGELYEPKEENPMIGWRGASRYYHPDFAPAFALEVKAIKKVRLEMKLKNVIPMIPFCRTVDEGKKVLAIMEQYGLSRRIDPTLKVYVMCEIPANVILADKFLDVFDGMSIGSNDLTQLTVGIDRDGNDRIRQITNENDAAVKDLIAMVIKKCKQRNKYIGICGQAPSDYPTFAAFLQKQGIESMSLNPDSVIKTILMLGRNKK
ncbi:MAG: phosphoenolpyruvate synthase [Minisyncoccia bacterium]